MSHFRWCAWCRMRRRNLVCCSLCGPSQPVQQVQHAAQGAARRPERAIVCGVLDGAHRSSYLGYPTWTAQDLAIHRARIGDGSTPIRYREQLSLAGNGEMTSLAWQRVAGYTEDRMGTVLDEKRSKMVTKRPIVLRVLHETKVVNQQECSCSIFEMRNDVCVNRGKIRVDPVEGNLKACLPGCIGNRWAVQSRHYHEIIRSQGGLAVDQRQGIAAAGAPRNVVPREGADVGVTTAALCEPEAHWRQHWKSVTQLGRHVSVARHKRGMANCEGQLSDRPAASSFCLRPGNG